MSGVSLHTCYGATGGDVQLGAVFDEPVLPGVAGVDCMGGAWSGDGPSLGNGNASRKGDRNSHSQRVMNYGFHGNTPA
ncbi:hypothetical protein C405_09445 [Stenotrophomonas maltophilia AU12-09]|nr:hypothetical protein C405_09445 [Stenotrophomonas maltophilia AU12-09]